MPKVYVDGRIIEADEPALPAGDRSVLFGDTVFETVRGYEGRPFRLKRHMERMRRSCEVLRLAAPEEAVVTDATCALLETNGLLETDSRIRVTLTGGDFSGELGFRRAGRPRLVITAVPYEPPRVAYEKGISLVISGVKRNSSSVLALLKTGNTLDSLVARQEAMDRGADDAIMLTTAGNLAEATSSNLFFVKGGEVSTPDMGCAFLPGITRDTILEICRDAGIRCTPVMGGPELLSDASEVFLTNSMVELLPVRSLGSREFECPGDVTRKLHDAYRDLIARELSLF